MSKVIFLVFITQLMATLHIKCIMKTALYLLFISIHTTYIRTPNNIRRLYDKYPQLSKYLTSSSSENGLKVDVFLFLLNEKRARLVSRFMFLDGNTCEEIKVKIERLVVDTEGADSPYIRHPCLL